MPAIQDLIKPQNSDLQIRENENGVYVAGVSEHEVSSMDDCLNFLHVGDRNRHDPRLVLCIRSLQVARGLSSNVPVSQS